MSAADPYLGSGLDDAQMTTRRARRLRTKPPRHRRIDARFVVAGMFCTGWFVVCATAGFSGDTWAVLLIAVPSFLAIVVALMRPVHLPSSALFSSDLLAGWTWLIRPYRFSLALTPVCAVLAYAGLAISQLVDPVGGLNAVLRDDEASFGILYPLLSAALAGLVMVFFIIAVVQPVTAAIDPSRLFTTDKSESLMLASYVTAAVAVGLTVASVMAASWSDLDGYGADGTEGKNETSE